MAGLSSPWVAALANAGLGMLEAGGQGRSTGEALAAGGRGALAGIDQVRQAGMADREHMMGLAQLQSQMESAAAQRSKWAADAESAQAELAAAKKQQEAWGNYAGGLSPTDQALFQADPEGYLSQATTARYRDPYMTVGNSVLRRGDNGLDVAYTAPMSESDRIAREKLGLDQRKFEHERSTGGSETTAALRTRAAKINDLVRLQGLDEATATSIVDGQIRTVTDPVRGSSVNQNLATGKTTAIEFPRKQVVGLGDGTGPVTIQEMAGEVGIVPWSEDVLSKTLGQAVPEVVSQERTKAATQLGFVKRLAQNALGTSSRPSIWEQQQIEELFPSKGIYDSEQRATYQLGQLRDMVEFTHSEYANQINSGALPVEQENELRGKMAELQSLHTLLPTQQQNVGPSQPQAGEVPQNMLGDDPLGLFQ